MRISSLRLNRGTSIIAALILAAVLGAIALGLSAFQSHSTNPGALGAEAAAAAPAPAGEKEQCQAGYDYELESSGALIAKPNKITECWNGDTLLKDTTVKPYGSIPSVQCGTQGAIFYSDKGTGKTAGKACNVGEGVNGNTPTTPGSTGAPTPPGTPPTVSSDGPPAACQASNYEQMTCSESQYCTSNPSAAGCNGIPAPNAPGGSTNPYLNKTIPPDSSTGNDPNQLTPATPNGADTNPYLNKTIPPDSSTGNDPNQLTPATTPDASPPPPNAPGGETINCDDKANEADCAGARPPGDMDTYCYDNNQTCYPPETQVPGLSSQGWNCAKDDSGETACTPKPTGTVTPPPGTQPPPGTPQPQPGPTAQPCPSGQTGTPPNCQSSQQPKAPTFPSQPSSPSSPSSPSQPQQQQQCSTIASLFGCQNQTISCQLSAQPNPLQKAGLPATLTWTTTGTVYSAQIVGIGGVPVPSGSYTVYPQQTTNYTLTVADQNNNQNSCTATVTLGTSAQAPYGTGTNGQPCTQPPQQPPASQCTVGSWQPTSATQNGCTTGWQCANGSGVSGAAQISCQPQVADVGMSVAISYSCSNGGTSTGSGFSTNNQASGSASAVVAKPPTGTNTANYGITCTDPTGNTSSAQCSVQVNQPSIVMIANPKSVASGQSSSIGWVTSGMQSCVASSPTDSTFTSQNANNLSVNGVAQTSPITSNTEYDLTCQTLGGQTKSASTIVSAGSGSQATSTAMTVSSNVDGGNANHGDTVTVNWQTPSSDSTTNSAVALWLIDVQSQAAIALIAGGQSTHGSYQWKIPNTGDTCDPNSPSPCASDLVAGDSYGIEADLYNPANAYLGLPPLPANAAAPNYTDSGYTPTPFTIRQ
jgi:hypothetical protein